MELREKLSFSKATIGGFERYPSRNGLTGILVLEAPLTPELAESLGKKDLIYNRRGIVHEWKGSIGFDEQMRGVELTVGKRGAGWKFTPSIVVGLSVKHRTEKSNGGDDITAVLCMRCHLSPDDGAAANTFCEEVNNDSFPLKLDPLQEALFEAGLSKRKDEAEGEEPAESVQ